MLKSKRILFVLFAVCVILCSCTNKNINESTGSDISMSNTELCGFGELQQAERATETYALEYITKVMFFESYDEQLHNVVAIDLYNEQLYTYPTINRYLDSNMPDYEMSDNDIEYVLALLEKYEVLQWNSVYTESEEIEYEDGYSWILYIQYSNNTVSVFGGSGVSSANVTPENFDEFVDDMINFTHSRVPNIKVYS